MLDPWDLYAQAYQWADEEVSKDKLSFPKTSFDNFRCIWHKLVTHYLCQGSRR